LKPILTFHENKPHNKGRSFAFLQVMLLRQ